MKYIRTKDGIFETINQSLYLLYIDGESLEKVIKQADTIGELCDCFIYENEKDGKIVEKILTYAGILYSTGDYRLKYGAIWTDKGLIYVAKMNEKGELELL